MMKRFCPLFKMLFMMQVIFAAFVTLLVCDVTCQDISVDEKEAKLALLPRYSGIIDFDDLQFDYFAQSEPRNYSLILLVGTKQVECEGCRIAQNALTIIANSWEGHNPSVGGLYFGFIEFTKYQETIKKLNINTAPFAIHYPPQRKPSQFDRNDDVKYLVSVSGFNSWIKSKTGFLIILKEPRDFTIVKYGTGLLLAVAAPVAFKLVTVQTMFAISTMGFIFSMLSGAMWISINSPPWMTSDGKKIMYYTHGRSQLRAEACIIFGLYACTNIGLILLGSKVRKLSGIKHIVAVIVCLAMTVLGFNQLAEYYSLKHGGLNYHYSLL